MSLTTIAPPCATVLLLACLAAPLAGQRPLTAVETLRISASAQEFAPIAGLAVSTVSGVVAVGQSDDRAILFFGPDGRPAGRFGQRGQGPGDFAMLLGRVAWRGDSLWTFDPGTRRITVIGADRKLSRTVPVPAVLTGPGGVRADGVASFTPVGLLPDGTLVVRATGDGAAPPWLGGDSLARGPLVRASVDGRLGAVLARRSAPAAPAGCEIRVPSRTADGGASSIGVPFCPLPISVIAMDGSRLVVGVPEVERVAGRAGYRLILTDLMRGDSIVVRKTAPEVPIPTVAMDSARRVLADRRGLPSEVREAVLAMRIPRHFPPVQRILLGTDGTIWIEEASLVTGPRRWRVVDVRGGDIGVVHMPRTVTPMAVFRGRMWGTASDGDGLQDVVRFAIRQ